MSRYRALDDIAFYEPVLKGGALEPSKKKVMAAPGDVVEIADTDAAPLLKRGAVVQE